MNIIYFNRCSFKRIYLIRKITKFFQIASLRRCVTVTKVAGRMQKIGMKRLHSLIANIHVINWIIICSIAVTKYRWCVLPPYNYRLNHYSSSISLLYKGDILFTRMPFILWFVHKICFFAACRLANE